MALMTPADLTAWRQRTGLNRLQAAEALGISRNTITRMEAGTSEIPAYIELATEALEARLNQPAK